MIGLLRTLGRSQRIHRHGELAGAESRPYILVVEHLLAQTVHKFLLRLIQTALVQFPFQPRNRVLRRVVPIVQSVQAGSILQPNIVGLQYCTCLHLRELVVPVFGLHVFARFRQLFYRHFILELISDL